MSTMLIPFLAVFLIFNKFYKKKGIKRSVYNAAFLIAFAVYTGAVFYFTGAGTLYDILSYGLEIKQEQINLIPFSKDIDITAYLQNILLFIPFGIMLPVLWTQFNKIKSVILAGFGFSLLIECSQLLNNRRTDIDDLILNTSGAVIGFAVSLLVKKICKNLGIINKYNRYEPVIYIAVMFIGRFFLFNEMEMAKLFYGF